MNAQLDELLGQVGRSDGIWFQANPGNAGDSLLAVAARQKFARLGIPVREITPGFDATDKVVVYGGGGNLVPYYRVAADFLARHHERARHLLLLPHSIDGHEALLARLGSNVTLVCRESISFQHCLRHAPHARVLLGHDLALDVELCSLLPWVRNRGMLAHALRHGLASGDRMPRRVLYLRKLLGAVRLLNSPSRRSARSTHGHLTAFRQDIESPKAQVPESNLDLSELLMLHDSTGVNAELAVRLLFGFLSRYRSVSTNRLHIAIAGGLLGMDVDLRANSYFKCAAVWEHSLRHRFPNIAWNP